MTWRRPEPSPRSPWWSVTRSKRWSMRPVLKELERRTTPWTSYPFSTSSSARYEPSWPVTPVMRAVFISASNGGAQGASPAERREGLGDEVDLLRQLAVRVADVEPAVVDEVGARERPGDRVVE